MAVEISIRHAASNTRIEDAAFLRNIWTSFFSAEGRGLLVSQILEHSDADANEIFDAFGLFAPIYKVSTPDSSQPILDSVIRLELNAVTGEAVYYSYTNIDEIFQFEEMSQLDFNYDSVIGNGIKSTYLNGRVAQNAKGEFLIYNPLDENNTRRISFTNKEKDRPRNSEIAKSLALSTELNLAFIVESEEDGNSDSLPDSITAYVPVYKDFDDETGAPVGLKSVDRYSINTLNGKTAYKSFTNIDEIFQFEEMSQLDLNYDSVIGNGIKSTYLNGRVAQNAKGEFLIYNPLDENNTRRISFANKEKDRPRNSEIAKSLALSTELNLAFIVESEEDGNSDSLPDSITAYVPVYKDFDDETGAPVGLKSVDRYSINTLNGKTAYKSFTNIDEIFQFEEMSQLDFNYDSVIGNGIKSTYLNGRVAQNAKGEFLIYNPLDENNTRRISFTNKEKDRPRNSEIAKSLALSTELNLAFIVESEEDGNSDSLPDSITAYVPVYKDFDDETGAPVSLKSVDRYSINTLNGKTAYKSFTNIDEIFQFEEMSQLDFNYDSVIGNGIKSTYLNGRVAQNAKGEFLIYNPLDENNTRRISFANKEKDRPRNSEIAKSLALSTELNLAFIVESEEDGNSDSLPDSITAYVPVYKDFDDETGAPVGLKSVDRYSINTLNGKTAYKSFTNIDEIFQFEEMSQLDFNYDSVIGNGIKSTYLNGRVAQNAKGEFLIYNPLDENNTRRISFTNKEKDRPRNSEIAKSLALSTELNLAFIVESEEDGNSDSLPDSITAYVPVYKDFDDETGAPVGLKSVDRYSINTLNGKTAYKSFTNIDEIFQFEEMSQLDFNYDSVIGNGIKSTYLNGRVAQNAKGEFLIYNPLDENNTRRISFTNKEKDRPRNSEIAKSLALSTELNLAFIVESEEDGNSDSLPDSITAYVPVYKDFDDETGAPVGLKSVDRYSINTLNGKTAYKSFTNIDEIFQFEEMSQLDFNYDSVIGDTKLFSVFNGLIDVTASGRALILSSAPSVSGWM